MKARVKSVMRPSYIRDRFIYVFSEDYDHFPPLTTRVELETDAVGVIETQFYVGKYRGFSRNLKPWFTANPTIKDGDTLWITVEEQDRRYRIEREP